MDYPIRFADQVKQHLRARRKARGLTKAQLGEKLGVGQARIAEIERDPGVVSLEQLLKVLTALDAEFRLRDDTRVVDSASSAEMRDWARKLGVSADDLMAALSAVGGDRAGKPPLGDSPTTSRGLNTPPPKGSW